MAADVSRITIAPYAPGDAAELLARGLRECDAREAHKVLAAPAADALAHSVATSITAATFRRDGRIIALTGLAVPSYMRGAGVPWLVGHDEFGDSAIAIAMARAVKRFTDHWLRLFGRLENYADPEHETALKLLAWMGFSFSPERARGPAGHELIHFWKEL